METETIARPPLEIRCSFCHKKAAEVDRLIAGFGVSICNECIDVAKAANRDLRPNKEREEDPVRCGGAPAHFREREAAERHRRG